MTTKISAASADKPETQSAYKILSFTPYYPPHLGGLEKYAQDLHRQFIKNGHTVTTFTADIAPSTTIHSHENPDGVIHYPAFDIIFGYPVPKFWMPSFWTMYAKLFKGDYDVVLSSTRFFLSSLLALFYSKTTGTPWLHIEHGSDFVHSENIFISIIARLYDETFGRLVLKSSDLNIAPSISAKGYIAKFNRKYCPVIYRGVDQAEIDLITPDYTWQKLHPNKTIITYAGRLIDGKGLPDLLLALTQLPPNKFIALLIGSGFQQNLLENLVAKHKLTDRVMLLGPKNHQETIALLKTSHIFVNPSYNEGLPTSVLEASLAECAIVATDVGGTSEIINHNKSGLLCQPRDVDTLASYLISLLDNQTLRAQLASSARSSVIQKFNWSKAYQNYLAAINQVT